MDAEPDAASLANFVVDVSSRTEEELVPVDWHGSIKTFFHENHDPQLDDLIFFVRGSDAGEQTAAEAEREESNEEMYAKALGGSEDMCFLKRRSKVMQGKVDATGIREFPGVDGVRWRDSFFLNVLLQLRYTVTVAVGEMVDDKFKAAEKVVADAFPSISRPESVVKKGQTLYTYPLLCFTFENFDELFSKIVVNRGQAVVFQLQVHGGAGKHLDLDVARNQARERRGTETANRNIRTTIFEGGVPYDKLQHGHQLRRSSMIDFRHADAKMAFLPMRGPGGKGRAEVGVVLSAEQPEAEGGGVEPAVEEEGLQRAMSWFSKTIDKVTEVATGPKISEYPALRVLLTTITIHWRTIWRDLAEQLDAR